MLQGAQTRRLQETEAYGAALPTAVRRLIPGAVPVLPFAGGKITRGPAGAFPAPAGGALVKNFCYAALLNRQRINKLRCVMAIMERVEEGNRR